MIVCKNVKFVLWVHSFKCFHFIGCIFDLFNSMPFLKNQSTALIWSLTTEIAGIFDESGNWIRNDDPKTNSRFFLHFKCNQDIAVFSQNKGIPFFSSFLNSFETIHKFRLNFNKAIMRVKPSREEVLAFF